MKSLDQIEDIENGRGNGALLYRSDILGLVDIARDRDRLRERILELVEHATEMQAERDALRAARQGLGEALGILEFHEGSGAPEFPGAHPTIRINAEDFATVLAAVRAASKSGDAL